MTYRTPKRKAPQLWSEEDIVLFENIAKDFSCEFHLPPFMKSITCFFYGVYGANSVSTLLAEDPAYKLMVYLRKVLGLSSGIHYRRDHWFVELLGRKNNEEF